MTSQIFFSAAARRNVLITSNGGGIILNWLVLTFNCGFASCWLLVKAEKSILGQEAFNIIPSDVFSHADYTNKNTQ